jgi:mannan endo-1,4-beta-mannosidase
MKRILLVASIFLSLGASVMAQSRFATFVTRHADTLFAEGRQLRFLSFNIPNLHYVEDYLPFDGTAPFRLPNAYEIRDALTSIRQLGGQVTRMYVLSVRSAEDQPGLIRHVEAPGRFNEVAFRALDTVLAIANEVGVRVIIPFVDNWPWWGGIREYAEFRGLPKEEFWTDPGVIADFEETMRYLITRRNTVTGAAYRDDRAILGWEIGNELDAPYGWTGEIAAFIRSLDTNHLIIDGPHDPELNDDALDDPHIDVVTTHHYGDPAVSISRIIANREKSRGRKPYVVGEFGIVPLVDIRAIADTIVNQGLAGGMIWSLRGHAREGGYYAHYEYNNVAAYHWPGSGTGDPYDERLVVSFMRDRAFRIDGRDEAREKIPEAPRLLPIDDPAAISWQGSAGAATYRVERQEAGGPWDTVGVDVDDSRSPYRASFSDETAQPGHAYRYRVCARNGVGESGYSNIEGPVSIPARTFVDDLRDYSRVYQKEGEFRLLSMEDVKKAKEDRDRLAGSDGSYLIYKFDDDVERVRVDWFRTGTGDGVRIGVSGDGITFAAPAGVNDAVFAFPKNEYGFYDAVTTTAPGLDTGVRYVRITLNGSVQLTRITATSKRMPPR